MKQYTFTWLVPCMLFSCFCFPLALIVPNKAEDLTQDENDRKLTEIYVNWQPPSVVHCEIILYTVSFVIYFING